MLYIIIELTIGLKETSVRPKTNSADGPRGGINMNVSIISYNINGENELRIERFEAPSKMKEGDVFVPSVGRIKNAADIRAALAEQIMLDYECPSHIEIAVRLDGEIKKEAYRPGEEFSTIGLIEPTPAEEAILLGVKDEIEKRRGGDGVGTYYSTKAPSDEKIVACVRAAYLLKRRYVQVSYVERRCHIWGKEDEGWQYVCYPI